MIVVYRSLQYSLHKIANNSICSFSNTRSFSFFFHLPFKKKNEFLFSYFSYHRSHLQVPRKWKRIDPEATGFFIVLGRHRISRNKILSFLLWFYLPYVFMKKNDWIVCQSFISYNYWILNRIQVNDYFHSIRKKVLRYRISKLIVGLLEEH